MYAPINPFVIAFQALTAPNARAYYAMRAQQDIGLAIWAVATAATAVYSLGYEVADALRVAVVEAQPEPVEALALPVSLEDVATMAMDAWAAARNMAHEAVDIIEAEIVSQPVLAPAGCAGYLPAASEPKSVVKRVDYSVMTKKSLQAECDRLHIIYRKSDSRDVLILKLQSTKVAGRPGPTKVGGISID